MDKVWMKPPFGTGEPKQVDSTPEVLGPLMVAGWSQIEAPTDAPAHTPAPKPVNDEEVTHRVHD